MTRRVECRKNCFYYLFIVVIFAILFSYPVISIADSVPVFSSEPIPSLQWSFTLENGGGIRGLEDSDVAEGIYHFGGHVYIFPEKKPTTKWAGGISLTAGSFDMRCFIAGAGASLLIPVSSFLPLIVEFVPTYIRGKGVENGMGLGGRVWWGIFGYNYHSSEVASVGIYAVFQKVIIGEGEKNWFVYFGIDISLHLIAIPFGIAWQAIQRKK